MVLSSAVCHVPIGGSGPTRSTPPRQGLSAEDGDTWTSPAATLTSQDPGRHCPEGTMAQWFSPWALESDGLGSNEQLLSNSVVCAGYSTCRAKPSEHGADITPSYVIGLL